MSWAVASHRMSLRCRKNWIGWWRRFLLLGRRLPETRLERPAEMGSALEPTLERRFSDVPVAVPKKIDRVAQPPLQQPFTGGGAELPFEVALERRETPV